MKIIQRGVLPKDKVYRTTCVNCKTIFEFSDYEATKMFDQRDGDYLIVVCPVCEQKCYKDMK